MLGLLIFWLKDMKELCARGRDFVAGEGELEVEGTAQHMLTYEKQRKTVLVTNAYPEYFLCQRYCERMRSYGELLSEKVGADKQLCKQANSCRVRGPQRKDDFPKQE